MSGYDQALYQTFLKSIPMFSTCSTEQLDHLAQLGDAITVSSDEHVVREGESSDDFYVVTSGALRVERGGKQVGSLGAGDYFGELALFDPAPRNATVSAEGTTASLVALNRKAFQDALSDIP